MNALLSKLVSPFIIFWNYILHLWNRIFHKNDNYQIEYQPVKKHEHTHKKNQSNNRKSALNRLNGIHTPQFSNPHSNLTPNNFSTYQPDKLSSKNLFDETERNNHDQKPDFSLSFNSPSSNSVHYSSGLNYSTGFKNNYNNDNKNINYDTRNYQNNQNSYSKGFTYSSMANDNNDYGNSINRKVNYQTNNKFEQNDYGASYNQKGKKFNNSTYNDNDYNNNSCNSNNYENNNYYNNNYHNNAIASNSINNSPIYNTSENNQDNQNYFMFRNENTSSNQRQSREYDPNRYYNFNNQSDISTNYIQPNPNHNHNYQQDNTFYNYNSRPQSQQPHRPLSREDKIRQKIGQETMEVTRTGQYTIFNNYSKKTKKVNIKDKIDWAVNHTETIKPLQPLPILQNPPKNQPICPIEVTTESSFAALKRVKRRVGIREACVLNFASATQPGGGFLNGRGAQEETLTRQSALYSSLLPQEEMYKYNKLHSNDPYYSDYMIYSPNVPFFRDDNYSFIDFFSASVITAPAVNYSELMKKKIRPDRVYEVMKNRCERILRLCISKGNKAIVLGAFGCGVFKNPPEMVSQIFRELLYDEGYGKNLQWVVFPIYDKDGKKDGHTFKVFEKTLQNV